MPSSKESKMEADDRNPPFSRPPSRQRVNRSYSNPWSFGHGIDLSASEDDHSNYQGQQSRRSASDGKGSSSGGAKKSKKDRFLSRSSGRTSFQGGAKPPQKRTSGLKLSRTYSASSAQKGSSRLSSRTPEDGDDKSSKKNYSWLPSTGRMPRLERSLSFKAFSRGLMPDTEGATKPLELEGLGSDDAGNHDIQVDLLEDSSHSDGMDSMGDSSADRSHLSSCGSTRGRHSYTCSPGHVKIAAGSKLLGDGLDDSSDHSLHSLIGTASRGRHSYSVTTSAIAKPSPSRRSLSPSPEPPKKRGSGTRFTPTNAQSSPNGSLASLPHTTTAADAVETRLRQVQRTTSKRRLLGRSTSFRAVSRSSFGGDGDSTGTLESDKDWSTPTALLHRSSSSSLAHRSSATLSGSAYQRSSSTCSVSPSQRCSASKLKHVDLDQMEAQGDVKSPSNEKPEVQNLGAIPAEYATAWRATQTYKDAVAGGYLQEDDDDTARHHGVADHDHNDDAFLNDIPGMQLPSRWAMAAEEHCRKKPFVTTNASRNSLGSSNQNNDYCIASRTTQGYKDMILCGNTSSSGSDSNTTVTEGILSLSLHSTSKASAKRSIGGGESSTRDVDEEEIEADLRSIPAALRAMAGRTSTSSSPGQRPSMRRVSFVAASSENEDYDPDEPMPLRTSLFKSSERYSMGWSTTAAASGSNSMDTSLKEIPGVEYAGSRRGVGSTPSSRPGRRASLHKVMDWNVVDQSINLMDQSLFHDEEEGTGSGRGTSRYNNYQYKQSWWQRGISRCGGLDCQQKLHMDHRRKRQVSIGALFVLMVAGVATVVYHILPMTTFRSDDGANKTTTRPTLAPTPVSRMDRFVKLFQEEFQFLTHGNSTSSAAFYALQWLVFKDQFDPLDPEVASRYALATLYFTTHQYLAPFLSQGLLIDDIPDAPEIRQEAWRRDDKWMSSSSVCHWYGVECENDVVTHLNLTRNQLMGELPVELKALSELVVLDLSHNPDMTGSIPGELFSAWPRLEYLVLQKNQFQESLPSELNGLTNLKELMLNENLLTGRIPDLRSLYDLAYLHLDHNLFTSTIPSWIGHLEKLQLLRLNNNMLTGTIPEEMSYNEGLGVLSLAGNNLAGPIPEIFEGLQKLTDLQLHQNLFRSALPTSIRRLTSLKRLTMDNCGMSGRLPSEWGESLTDLQALVLHHNTLVGPIPSEFGQMESLRNLWINHNFLQGEVPSQLGQLSNTLAHLFLESNAFHGLLPEELGNLEYLDGFRLHQTMVTGTVPGSVCALELSELQADCEEIVCDCCTKCF